MYKVADDLLVTDEALEDPNVMRRLLSDFIERLGSGPLVIQDNGVTVSSTIGKINFVGFTITKATNGDITITAV